LRREESNGAGAGAAVTRLVTDDTTVGSGREGNCEEK